MSVRRGFTLVEVLVTIVLVSIGLTVLTMALVPSLRLSLRGHQRIELQQSGQLALRSLQDDLSHSARAGLRLGEGWLSLHRLREVSAGGAQVWEDHLVVYRWPGETLTRSLWRPADLDLARPLQPDSIPEAELSQTRVVAKGAESVRIALGAPMRVELTLRRGDNRLTLERWIYLRNSAR